MILSPQHNLNILHAAKASAVNLKSKSDPNTPCLNSSWGLRTDLLPPVSICPGSHSGAESSDGDEVAIPEGEESDTEAGLLAGPSNPWNLRRFERGVGNHLPMLFFWLAKRMDCGLASLHLSQSSYMMWHHSLSRKIKPLSFALHFPESQVERGPLFLYASL